MRIYHNRGGTILLFSNGSQRVSHAWTSKIHGVVVVVVVVLYVPTQSTIASNGFHGTFGSILRLSKISTLF